MNSFKRPRFIPALGVLLAVLLLILPGPGVGTSPSNTLLLTAPFHGSSSAGKYNTTGCAKDRFFSPPRFNESSGFATVIQRSAVTGSRCPNQVNQGYAKSQIGFLTKNFSGIGGARQLLVTWNVSWVVNLTEVGGYKNASSTYSIGVSYTQLCWAGPGNCTKFQNSGGGGSSTGTTPWAAGGEIPGKKRSNLTTNRSYAQNAFVFLNTTLNSSISYNIFVSLDVMTLASAVRSGHDASAKVWLTAKLVSIYVK
jgi:hypothetical protein